MTDKPLNELAERINENARDHGFWPEEGRNMGEMLMLATSELAEALEEHRAVKPAIYFRHTTDCQATQRGIEETIDQAAGGWCTCDPKPEGIAVEIGDCIIRCLDTMKSLNVDIDRVVDTKMSFNERRPMKHGKAY